MKAYFYLFLLVITAFLACKEKEVVNPYATEVPETLVETVDLSTLPNDNFAWLHHKIFKPTCANSGCHDGSFEPHFSSISSSYATLVNHPVISNDANFSFDYRVTPGYTSTSLLYERLTNEIPNSSGMMPLVVDADSDWNDRRDEYLAAISAWINNGAPDMYGNPAPSDTGDFPPQIEGLMVFPEGNTTTPYERDPEIVGVSPIIAEATTVDIWVAVTDDNTQAASMSVNELRISTEISDVDDAAAHIYSTASQINAPGFGGGSITYWHKATVDLGIYDSGTTLFLRSYFDDGVQSEVTAIPNEGSNNVVTTLFTIQLP